MTNKDCIIIIIICVFVYQSCVSGEWLLNQMTSDLDI